MAPKLSRCYIQLEINVGIRNLVLKKVVELVSKISWFNYMAKP